MADGGEREGTIGLRAGRDDFFLSSGRAAGPSAPRASPGPAADPSPAAAAPDAACAAHPSLAAGCTAPSPSCVSAMLASDASADRGWPGGDCALRPACCYSTKQRLMLQL